MRHTGASWTGLVAFGSTFARLIGGIGRYLSNPPCNPAHVKFGTTLPDVIPRMARNVRPSNFSTCIIEVMHHDAWMQANDSKTNSDPKPGCPRITVTLPPDHYQEILRVAKSKRVSASWVVRDAVEKYLAEDSPLFAATARRLP